MNEEIKNEIVNILCETISKTGIQNNNKELVEVLAQFMFSIGSSLENIDVGSGEDVLLRYAQNPTLGNVLMAQALHMKETWIENERKENGQSTRIIQGQTEEE